MKKLFFIAAIAATFSVFISSCAKEGCTNPYAPNYSSSATKDNGSCIDWTALMVGTYTGTAFDSTGGTGQSFPNYQITVTKIDDSHIQISSPANNGAFDATFTATISNLANGIYSLTVPVQASAGVSPYIVAGGGTYSGYYNSTTRTFGMGIISTQGLGNADIETFTGTH